MPLISTPENLAPPGAIEEHIRAADGVRLRTARWAPSSPVGTVVLLGGRGEFIEKYFEVVGELLARGFAVAAMDWRGQGGSDRPLRHTHKGHVDDFSQFESDLDALVTKVLERECPRPWIGLSHSMGAAVLLGAAGSGRCPFERLALTSPMIAVKGVNHRGRVRVIVAALNGLGLGGAFAPGGGGENQWLASFAGNAFTSDEGRFARVANLVAACPDLRLGGPTIGWTHAAFRHMRRLDHSRFPRTPLPPILIVAAGADRVTDTPATLRLASRLGVDRTVVIEGAEHEILIERDDLRAKFWAAFDHFVAGSAPKSSQPEMTTGATSDQFG
jgi:lysophospholipase